MISLATWWTPQQAGLIGGLLGTLVGLVGAGLGVACALLVPRGRARPLILGSLLLMTLLGLASLGVGLFALASSQPYAVWYPLILLGILSTSLFGALTPVVLGRYRAAELRRLHSEELRRGSS